jgi:hypothetical protein
MNFANAAIRAHWARRATYHVTAARSHLYLLAGTWEPERDLPEEHRLIITPQEFRSSPNVILVDPRLLRVIDDRTEQLLSLSAREFEVFVAELLERLGYSIDLSRSVVTAASTSGRAGRPTSAPSWFSSSASGSALARRSANRPSSSSARLSTTRRPRAA